MLKANQRMTTDELIQAQEDQRDRNYLIYYLVCSAIVVFILLAWAGISRADEVKVDLHKIMMIESSGNPLAHNKKDDSRGLYQITPICLKEYNNFHPNGQYTMDDLWNASVSTKIADWYLNKRIPQMLRHYRKPDLIQNRLIAYNAGISYVVHDKKLPEITQQYLIKYYK